MNSRYFLLSAALGVLMGTSLGWWWRAQHSARADVEASIVGGEFSPTTLLADKADPRAEEYRASKGAERWLHLMTWAEKATLDDMPRLIRLAKGNDEALSLLAARWIEMNPRHMFDTLAKAAWSGDYLGDTQELLNKLFEEWPKRDLNAAIAALSETRLPAAEGLRMSMSNTVMRLDPERALGLLKEWNINNYSPDLRKLEEWARSDPRRAADATIKAGSGYGVLSALTKIGEAWAKKDGKAAMEYAVKLPPWQRAQLGRGALKTWAKEDPKAAAAYLKEASLDIRSEMAGSLVAAWSESDPQAAYDWSKENLKGEAKTRAASDLVRATMGKDPDQAKAIVNGMAPSQERNLAASALVHEWVKEDMFNYPKRAETIAKRDEVLAWIGSLPDKEAARHALKEQFFRLLGNGPAEAAGDFLAKHPDIAPDNAWSHTASNLARVNPGKALDWAQGLPEGPREQAKSSVVGEWLRSQPEAATAWAMNSPAESRDAALRLVATQASYMPDEQATRWFQSIPSSDRASLRAAIQISPITEEKRAFLLKVVGGK